MSHHLESDDEPLVVIEKHESGIGTFLVGAAIGVGVALLFAPRSGAETRAGIGRGVRQVRRAAQDVVQGVADQVVGTVDEARRAVEGSLQEARNAVEIKRRQVHRAVNAGRVAAADARAELEERIAVEKAGRRRRELGDV